MTRRSIHTQFLEMQKKVPVSTVLVTHDPEEAARLADYIVVMETGRVLQFGPVRTVLEQPANDYVRDLCTGLAEDLL
jgi:molybdate transport system permease protein